MLSCVYLGVNLAANLLRNICVITQIDADTYANLYLPNTSMLVASVTLFIQLTREGGLDRGAQVLGLSRFCQSFCWVCGV